MRLQDMHWMAVENYLQHDHRIILTTGSTEQHGYLSLMADILIPTKIAEAVAKRENIIVAPPLNFGVNSLFSEFPGTISLSKNTFETVLLEIIEVLLTQGFDRFLIINGHETNHLPDAIKEHEIEGHLRVQWFDWWRSNAAKAFEQRYDLPIEHANWSENFPFTRVGPSPKEEKELLNADYLREQDNIRAVIGDGSMGGLYQVEDILTYILFDEVTAEAALLARSLTA